MLGLTSYFDDSGTHDQSPLVTIGGPLLSRIQFKELSKRWDRCLTDRKIAPPLHMTDFIYPGKYCGWFPEIKRELFREVSKIINECKFYSVAILVSRDDFNAELSEEVRTNLIGPYAFAFFCAVLANLSAIEQSRFFEGRIAYLVDVGCAHPEQLSAAHSAIANGQKGSLGQARLGGFAQDSDDKVPALQAADVVAWASGRKHLEGFLPEGFEPINAILDDHLHVSVSIPRDGIGMLADPINNWITKRGSMPRLGDVVKK